MKFLSESNGAQSSMRLVYVGWNVGLLLMVAFSVWSNKTLPNLEELSGIIGLVALLTTGKVWQKTKEAQ